MNKFQIINRMILEYEDDIFDEVDFINYVENELSSRGIIFGDVYYNSPLAARLILLTEAANLAAKWYSETFYEFKENLCQLALDNGASGWINEDDWGNQVLYLYHPLVGVASFHFLIEDVENYFDGPRYRGYFTRWSWSGIYRQDRAFDLLVDADLLSRMAWATRPRQLGYPTL